MGVVENGLYTVKDSYFEDFPNKYFMDNKKGNRPYFFTLLDSDGIYWMIPMSKQVDTYRPKIAKEEAKRGKGNCIFYHIGVIAGAERAFSIGDSIPITADYIDSPYTIKEIHYVSRDQKMCRELRSKAMRFLKLVENGKIHTNVNIMAIKKKLLGR
ncbi:MAG: hypothetical protein GXY32_03990 [Ruminococcaceae bacterium]|nr:hypothetical protein [Oscillospiraceae bacterium]